jgi:PAS domain S-box-containing protein
MLPVNHVLINKLSPAIFLLDQTGSIIYASDRITKLLGYDSREVVGVSCFDLFFLNKPALARKRYQKMIERQNMTVNALLQARHKNGAAEWLELTAVNLLHVAHVRGVLITAQRFVNQQRSDDQKIAQLVVNSQETERVRLSAELHDNINQIIGMSVVFIEKAMLDEQKREKLLSDSSRLLKEAIEEIRQLSYALSSSQIWKEGLHLSIKKLGETLSSGSGLRIVTKISPKVDTVLDPDQQLNVFRIIQEQMQNIVKHAKASKVLIALSCGPHGVVLKIKDNGGGFDMNSRRHGIGIFNMMQRAKALNGHLHLTSEIGRGTAVTALFGID